MNSTTPETTKGNILIVDDTPENLQLLSITLSDWGYKVRGVIKGSMALRTARVAAPNLILLDIKMPEMNGYEVCQQLKADPQTCEIPVIFLSALDEVVDKVRAFSVGGIDYITKPFQIEEVLARVENQLTIQKLQKQLKEHNKLLQQEIQERQKAEKAALAASQAKSEFVAHMSHELRTPLNAILGFTQLLKRDLSLNTEQQENVKIISCCGEHLLDLIEDVLEMSKIEAGRIFLHENSFDIYRLFDNLEKMLQVEAEAKGLQLSFIVSSQVPQYVTADEKKLRCCLINLLGNAIKFTDSGHVTLRVSVRVGTQIEESRQSSHSPLSLGSSREPQSSNFQCFLLPVEAPISQSLYSLFVEVEDTGSGISADEIDTLFNAFVQTETGRKSNEGTGLGLAITRKYVQVMGGNITVESVLGQGTIFKFDVNLTAVDASEVGTKPLRRAIALELDQQVHRILVVDDTQENRLLLVKLLEPMGYEMREAENGREGVLVWESWQPHLIFMDTRMPVMDGIEATKQIRNKEEQRNKKQEGKTEIYPFPESQRVKRVPIIALTGSAFEERRGEILAAGGDDFVRKPFAEEVIYEKLAQYLGVRYLYEDLPDATTAAGEKWQAYAVKSDSFFREKLAAMPLNWVKELYEAANHANEELVIHLIQKIQGSNTPLADALGDLVKDYRLDIIVRLTHSIID